MSLIYLWGPELVKVSRGGHLFHLIGENIHEGLPFVGIPKSCNLTVIVTTILLTLFCYPYSPCSAYFFSFISQKNSNLI